EGAAQSGTGICRRFRSDLSQARAKVRRTFLPVRAGRRGTQSEAQPGRWHASESGRRAGDRAALAAVCRKAGRRGEALMFKRLLSVGGFTLLSRITGFLRDVLMAKVLGSGILSDAFVVAFLFPNYFRSIFGEGTVNPAFLPRYAALWA